ncbi:MAG: phage holin family protein [Actinomycetota bacterium]|nr:phage holin family protein [Actinomycetota bacterium]
MSEESGPSAVGEADTPPVRPPDEQVTDGGHPPEEMTVGELVFEISDRATVLVREEIELAKTEVTEKLNRLLQGGVTAIVAGVFVLAALAMIMHGIAWLLNDLFFEDNVWAGFLVEAAIFLVLAGVGGLYAYKTFQKASPPVPEMAIEEAKEIKTAFESEGKS